MHINDLELYFMILQQIKNDLDNLLLCLHGKNMFVTPLCFPHPCIVRKFTSSYRDSHQDRPDHLVCFLLSFHTLLIISHVDQYLASFFCREPEIKHSRLRGPREKLRVYLCVYTTKEKTNFPTLLLNKLKM